MKRIRCLPQIRFYVWKQGFPCNTDQTILFSYGFQTFDFRWFSVVDFKLPKSNWNNIRKTLYTTVKKPDISNWKPTFLKRWKYVFNGCCVTRVCYDKIIIYEESSHQAKLAEFTWFVRWVWIKFFKKNTCQIFGHIRQGRPYCVHEYTMVSPSLPKNVFSYPPTCKMQILS